MSWGCFLYRISQTFPQKNNEWTHSCFNTEQILALAHSPLSENGYHTGAYNDG